MKSNWILILIVFFAYFCFRSIKIASDSQRFAEFVIGRFRGLRGPGLCIKFSGAEVRWYRLSTGDRGELIAPGLAKFGKIDIPVKADETLRVGSTVRITGFDESAVVIMYDPDQRKTIICEKCKHEMSI